MSIGKPKLLTANDLLKLRGKGIKGELIRGVFYKNEPTGVIHGETTVNVCCGLSKIVTPHRFGRLAIGAGIWLERDPDTVRKADVLFVSAERLSLDVQVPGYLELIPDLIVEVVSFNESAREVYDKARMWLSYGVPLTWVVDPNTQTVDVHRPGLPMRQLNEGEVLDGAPVLPGFTLPVREVFN